MHVIIIIIIIMYIIIMYIIISYYFLAHSHHICLYFCSVKKIHLCVEQLPQLIVSLVSFFVAALRRGEEADARVQEDSLEVRTNTA